MLATVTVLKGNTYHCLLQVYYTMTRFAIWLYVTIFNIIVITFLKKLDYKLFELLIYSEYNGLCSSSVN